MDVERLVKNFDHHDADFAKDPYRVYSELRSRCPVAHTEAHEGFYVVTKYRDVVAVAKDDYTFLSAPGVTIPPDPLNEIPIEVDPPEFFGYRRLLNPLFSPSAVATIEPEIRQLTTELIDAFVEKGEVDFVEDLARPMPAITTLRLIGLDESEWRKYADPIHFASMLQMEDVDINVAAEGLIALYMGLQEVVAARRDEPADDIVTYLVQADIEGRPLSDQEIMDMCLLLLLGGVDTTTGAIGNALLFLGQNSDVRQRLIDDPSLIPMAVEEFLRYEAPVQGLARTVAKDCEVGGQRLESGDRLLLMWASANRDEDEFPNADEVVIDRAPNRHLAFGVGIHRCLGSHLARAEFRIALEEVLARVPDYRVDYDRVRRAPNVGTVYAHMSVPATFKPKPVARRGRGGRAGDAAETAAGSRG